MEYARGLSMISSVYIILILISLALIVSLAWRAVSRRFEVPCPAWMKWLLDPPFINDITGRTRKTVEHLDLESGMQVLDAGCGTGRVTIPIARAVGPEGEVTAIDMQDAMLREVGRRAADAGLANIRLLRMGLGTERLEPGRYDRAVMVTVLGEIPDREAALSDLFLALKPGGILLVEETVRDPHYQSRSTVLELAGAAGFVEKEYFGNWFSFALALEKPA
jgi:ubiquinone/menaquinone biosynthesis C-methylase UbiE